MSEFVASLVFNMEIKYFDILILVHDVCILRQYRTGMQCPCNRHLLIGEKIHHKNVYTVTDIFKLCKKLTFRPLQPNELAYGVLGNELKSSASTVLYRCRDVHFTLNFHILSKLLFRFSSASRSLLCNKNWRWYRFSDLLTNGCCQCAHSTCYISCS